jgi:hypothetical protein
MQLRRRGKHIDVRQQLDDALGVVMDANDERRNQIVSAFRRHVFVNDTAASQ